MSLEKFEIEQQKRTSFVFSSLKGVPFQLLPFSKYPEDKTDAGLAWQEKFADALQDKPEISICLVVNEKNREVLAKIFEALTIQSYQSFQLLVAANNQADAKSVRKLFSQHDIAGGLLVGEGESYISQLKGLFSAASGSYLLHHYGQRILHPQALFIYAKAIIKGSPYLIYSNELVVDESWKDSVEFFRKSSIDKYTILSVNTLGHGLVVSKDLANAFCEDATFDAGEEVVDWEIVSRAITSDKQIDFIPLALFVSRTSATVTEEEISFKDSEYLCKRHAERIGVLLEEVSEYAEGVHTQVRPVAKDVNEKIQAIVPFKDQVDYTLKCISSLARQTLKEDLELTLVNNGSSEKSLSAIKSAAEESGLSFNLIDSDGYFNYARINNEAASTSSAPLILLLNNDVELTDPKAIEELRRWCVLDDVGIVGGKLFFDDGSVQSAAISFGSGRPVNLTAEVNFTDVVRETNGVTFALALMKRSIFDELGGLDEFYCPNGFGDALFCNRVWEMEKRILYTPFAKATHYESRSRKLIPEELEFFEMHSLGLNLPEFYPDFEAKKQPWRASLTIKVEQPPVQQLATKLLESRSLKDAANSVASGVLQLSRVGRTLKAKRVARQ